MGWREGKDAEKDEHSTEQSVGSLRTPTESSVTGALKVKTSKSQGRDRSWTVQSLVKDFCLYPKINGKCLKVSSRGVT